MAIAKRMSALPVPPPPDVIVLELSVDEADAVATVLSRVGGSPTDSPRRHLREVAHALYRVADRHRFNGQVDHLKASIYFTDDK